MGFGTQAIDKIIEMLDFMPSCVLIGKLCPRNMEATIFAVLAGSQNFGSTVASLAGGIFNKEMGLFIGGPTEEEGPIGYSKCINPTYNILGVEWTTLTIARAMGGIFLPMITVPLTFILLPDGLLTDDFVDLDTQVQMTEALFDDGAPPAPPSNFKLEKSLSQLDGGIAGNNGLQMATLASLHANGNMGSRMF